MGVRTTGAVEPLVQVGMNLTLDSFITHKAVKELLLHGRALSKHFVLVNALFIKQF
jgi:hypothetical protein